MTKLSFDTLLKYAFTDQEYSDYERVIKNNVKLWLEHKRDNTIELPLASFKYKEVINELLEDLK